METPNGGSILIWPSAILPQKILIPHWIEIDAAPLVELTAPPVEITGLLTLGMLDPRNPRGERGEISKYI